MKPLNFYRFQSAAILQRKTRPTVVNQWRPPPWLSKLYKTYDSELPASEHVTGEGQHQMLTKQWVSEAGHDDGLANVCTSGSLHRRGR